MRPCGLSMSQQWWRKITICWSSLPRDTIKKIYNTYVDYRNKVDVFYVAFSGGKDSIAVLDLVQRALPHNEFEVLFGIRIWSFQTLIEL